MAEEFCAKTGITSLAVAIGSAHGFYKETPKLEYETLNRSTDAVDTFLVLHGAAESQRISSKWPSVKGINKFNVARNSSSYITILSMNIVKYTVPMGISLMSPSVVQEKLLSYLVKKVKLSKF